VELLDGVLRWVQDVAFLTVAGWALARGWRDGEEQSRWLAATFGVLGFSVLLGLVGGLVFGGQQPTVLARLSVTGLVAFPYLLLRFLGTFEPVPARFRRVIEVVVLLQLAMGLVVPLDPRADGSLPPALLGFTVAVVGTWLTVLPYVGQRFWRASRGRPTLVRRRLRLLGGAVVVLSIALLVTATDTGEPGDVTRVATRVLALASAGLFVVGFVPPPAVRRWWRHPEERQLFDAAVNLLSATTATEVARILAPRVQRLASARAVAIVHEGDVVAAVGVGEHDRRRLAAGDAGDAHRTRLAGGELLVWPDPYAPLFGTGEQELLERTALLADLGLHRVRLLAGERAAREELEETNVELESFVYSASHDLKSPLIAMLSYLDLLQEEHVDELGEEAGWYVERMRANGRYMESLIQDLLELSRVGRVETEAERVLLGRTVAEVAAELGPQHPALHLEVGPLPTVWMNGTRARQLVANLLENAAKHGGEGPVHVDVRAASAPDGAVLLTVVDDGPGVPEPYRERVFGVFERLEADGDGGTGIGLAICRKIVETFGGRIWLADRDRGAEFRVWFPPHVVLERPGHLEEVTA
jgi:signal transduction histidine kinase